MKLSPHFVSRASALVLMFSSALSAQQPVAPPPAPIKIEKDIVYSHADGAELKLDIARPPESVGPGPFPVVVYFHGGGWQGGKRQDGYNPIRFFASQGFVGITVSYRFVPDHPWPAQVHDAKTAVRYVRAHAKELNIDPNRIASAGDSAGAYLALMLGLTAPEDGLEGDGEWKDASSRVQAVVSSYSVADFTRGRSLTEEAKTPEQEKKRVEMEALFQAYYKKSVAQVVADMGGTSDPKSPRWRQMSPIIYVSKGDSPTLILQGDADTIVSPQQAYWLDEAMTTTQVPHELLIIKGGGHGFNAEQYKIAYAKTLEFLHREMPAKAKAAASVWGDATIPIEKGLVYGRAGNTELKLDLARPREGNGPFPAVVWIHGGGWMNGDRSMGHGPLRLLATHGYVAASISHRFTTEAKWPAQIHDAKAAVRYLRAHAKELNLDPDRIGVMGESSGGHLALMVGLTDAKDGLEGDSGSSGISSRVQAVVSYCTLTDFTKLRDVKPQTEAEQKNYDAKRGLLVALAGSDDPKAPIWRELSPVTYVDRNDPPVLMFQGERDDVVPPEHIDYLEEKLREQGTVHQSVRAPNAGHAWKGEDRVMTNRVMLDFFAKHLGGKPAASGL
ncbi:alpha/beta hydrolase fold domain-containing protein [Oleiharenicola lentus]|uniref:alpha/beta hydrolase fold domain-containing protein n=1 Tax=Oleiharenicola lentus TaxID=2508720 RepID=UPI003F66A995